MTRVNSETVFAVVREHGPITKTELARRIYGIDGGSPMVERLLDELRQAKRVTLTAGPSKNGNRRAWVYSVTP